MTGDWERRGEFTLVAMAGDWERRGEFTLLAMAGDWERRGAGDWERRGEEFKLAFLLLSETREAKYKKYKLMILFH
jgi:hypothetical protein